MSDLEKALEWTDEMAFDILNGQAHSAEDGVKMFRTIEDAARRFASLTSPETKQRAREALEGMGLLGARIDAVVEAVLRSVEEGTQ